jgi:hypothetical protein
MKAFVVGGLLLAILAQWATIEWYKDTVEERNQEITKLELALDTCNTRILNIKADRKRDEKVGDPRNFDVPSEWMFVPQ